MPLAVELFVVHIHHEDLLSKVKESLAKALPITKQAIQRCALAARPRNLTKKPAYRRVWSKRLFGVEATKASCLT